MGKKNKHVALPAKQVGGIALAAKWPVHEVLLSRGWDQEAALITILVARRSLMSNKVAAGLFLVDLACLGVKSAQVKLFAGPAEYNAGLRAHALKIQPMASAEFNLVAKIIATGPIRRRAPDRRSAYAHRRGGQFSLHGAGWRGRAGTTDGF
jgi:hypothetical protein